MGLNPVVFCFGIIGKMIMQICCGMRPVMSVIRNSHESESRASSERRVKCRIFHPSVWPAVVIEKVFAAYMIAVVVRRSVPWAPLYGTVSRHLGHMTSFSMDICVVSSFSDLISDFLKFKDFCLPALFQNPTLNSDCEDLQSAVCNSETRVEIYIIYLILL